MKGVTFDLRTRLGFRRVFLWVPANVLLASAPVEADVRRWGIGTSACRAGLVTVRGGVVALRRHAVATVAVESCKQQQRFNKFTSAALKVPPELSPWGFSACERRRACVQVCGVPER